MTDSNDVLTERSRDLLDVYPRATVGGAKREAMRQRLLAGVEAGAPAPFDLPPPTAAKGMSVALKLIVAGAVATTAGAVALALMGTPDPQPQRGVVAPPIVAAAKQPAATPSPPPAPRPAPAAVVASSDAPEAEADAAPAEHVVEPNAKRPQSPARDGKQAPKSTAAEEARLLAAAQKALKSGQHREALRLADEHARRFPAGTLVEAREAARAIARCHLTPAERGAIRVAFERRHAGSAFGRRVTNACAD